MVDPSEVTADINLVSKSGYIDVEVKEKLVQRQKLEPLKRSPSTSISMFSPEGDKHHNQNFPIVCSLHQGRGSRSGCSGHGLSNIWSDFRSYVLVGRSCNAETMNHAYRVFCASA